MSRRIFSICILLGLLLLSLVVLPISAQAQVPTATPTAGCNPPPPTYYVTVTPSATSVNTGDQIDVSVITNVGISRFSLAVIDNATGLVQSQTDPIFTPAAPVAQTPPGGVYTVHWTLTAVRAGTVILRGSVSGEVLVCSGGNSVYTWGYASGQSGNVTVSGLPVTPIATLTPTATATIKNTPTRTRTPTNGPSLTPTRTPTRTPTSIVLTNTPTPVTGGTCSPVTSTITAPFTFDGAGTFCWRSSNLGAYINSWSTTSVTLNGVNVTNMYIASGSYPAKIGGFWYVGYNSAVAWGHFEAK